jgi:hypothetical protein
MVCLGGVGVRVIELKLLVPFFALLGVLFWVGPARMEWKVRVELDGRKRSPLWMEAVDSNGRRRFGEEQDGGLQCMNTPSHDHNEILNFSVDRT